MRHRILTIKYHCARWYDLISSILSCCEIFHSLLSCESHDVTFRHSCKSLLQPVCLPCLSSFNWTPIISFKIVLFPFIIIIIFMAPQPFRKKTFRHAVLFQLWIPVLQIWHLQTQKVVYRLLNNVWGNRSMYDRSNRWNDYSKIF